MSARPVVLVVLGTRPEAIKLAPVVRALKSRGGIDCRVVSTGQHRQVLAQALEAFGLRADYDLRLMRPAQTPGAFAKRAFAGLVPLIRKTRPALVVVQGDTTTALCGALAAFHEAVPIAHVEAGVRSFDLSAPFPEEANRVVIDDLADLMFAATRDNARNLGGPRHGRVVVTGNTVVDALRWASRRPRAVRDRALAGVLERLGRGEQLILATMHRRESFDGGLERACGALARLLDEVPSARLVFPVHLNPKVQAAARAALRHPRAHLLSPLDYPDLLAALRRARLVLTDSGGLQEEAACLGRPVLVLRRRSDRPEAVRAGGALVVGLEPRAIVSRARRVLEDARVYRRMARPLAVFGDGKASERIAAEIRVFLGLNARPRRSAGAPAKRS